MSSVGVMWPYVSVCVHAVEIKGFNPHPLIFLRHIIRYVQNYFEQFFIIIIIIFVHRAIAHVMMYNDYEWVCVHWKKKKNK